MDTASLAPVRLPVDPDDCPIRLDVFLTDGLQNLSRSRLQHLVRDGRVLVNGKPVLKPGILLNGGEVVEVSVPPVEAALPVGEPIPIKVLYEDADLLVVNKPAGMVVHPGAGVHTGTLVNALLHHCTDLSGIGGVVRPGIVHRLDRLTTGCLCVAKNDFAHERLSAQLADRTMSREYLAWVCGEMQGIEGRVEAPIGRSPNNPTRMAVVRRGGRPAATRWEVELRAPGLTRLRCRLESGRTHQVRVHLAHVGHPVVGDPEYWLAARDARMRVPPGYPAIIQALSRAERQLLHAARLKFTHPRTGALVEVEAPVPDDFRAFDAALAPFSHPPPVGE